MPKTPVENVKFVVDTVKSWRRSIEVRLEGLKFLKL